MKWNTEWTKSTSNEIVKKLETVKNDIVKNSQLII